MTNRIRAHVVAASGVTDAELSRVIAGPTAEIYDSRVFDFADSLPKTSTGKVDRQALITA